MSVHTSQLARAAGAFVANVAQNVYTVPAGKRTIVKDVLVTAGGATTVYLLVNGVTVLCRTHGAVTTTEPIDERGLFRVLVVGDVISILSTVTTTLGYHVSGTQLDV